MVWLGLAIQQRLKKVHILSTPQLFIRKEQETDCTQNELICSQDGEQLQAYFQPSVSYEQWGALHSSAWGECALHPRHLAVCAQRHPVTTEQRTQRPWTTGVCGKEPKSQLKFFHTSWPEWPQETQHTGLQEVLVFLFIVNSFFSAPIILENFLFLCQPASQPFGQSCPECRSYFCPPGLTVCPFNSSGLMS